MNFEPRRYLSVAFVTASLVSSASIAHATMTCWRFDELDRVSDLSAQEKLETDAKALPGLEKPEIRHLEGHYFMVQGAGKFCKRFFAVNIVFSTCEMAWSGTCLPFAGRA